MASFKDSLVDLDRYRSQLEDSVAKLRKSLQYWQTWEAEYEGLKEEILRLGEVHTKAELAHVGQYYEGTALNDKEVKLLLRTPNGDIRNAKQIVHIISKRLDYVQKNVKTIDRQLDIAIDKLATLEAVSRPEVGDDGGLPLTEIREELDEEGNVISSTATRAGDTAPRIVEALRKAGVKDLPETSASQLSERDLPTDRVKEVELNAPTTTFHDGDGSRPHSEGIRTAKEEADTPPPHTAISPSNAPVTRPLGRKKSVSFAEGTKTEDSTISRKRLPHPLFANRPRPTTMAPESETIADVKAKTPEGQLNSLLHAESNILASKGVSSSDSDFGSPVLPKSESPEDAALRRQMLQYNMREVGAVVAEIDLDEHGEGSTPPYSSDEDEDDDDSSVEEEEDEDGRATNVMLSEEYVKEMQALENKLNASMIRNVGPDAQIQSPSTSTVEQDLKPADGQTPDSSGASPTIPTKGVRFAETLDIQEAPVLKGLNNESDLTSINGAATDLSPPVASTEKKVSRFKSARGKEIARASQTPELDTLPPKTASISDRVLERPPTTSIPTFPPPLPPSKSLRPTPTGPADRTLAEKIVEWPYTATANPDAAPQEPDEFDPALLHQEANAEYHRQRNRMIHRQGGFLRKEEDEDDIPVDEDGEEQPRKMSRFMAARLGKG